MVPEKWNLNTWYYKCKKEKEPTEAANHYGGFGVYRPQMGEMKRYGFVPFSAKFTNEISLALGLCLHKPKCSFTKSKFSNGAPDVAVIKDHVAYVIFCEYGIHIVDEKLIQLLGEVCYPEISLDEKRIIIVFLSYSLDFTFFFCVRCEVAYFLVVIIFDGMVFVQWRQP